MTSTETPNEDIEKTLDLFFRFGNTPPIATTSPKPLAEVAEFACFDTETSGLSRDDVVVQVAVGLFDAEGRALGFYNRLWGLPEGVKMRSSAFKVHKISSSLLRKDGLDPARELRVVQKIFSALKRRGKKIVAFNANFDCRMLEQTARRVGATGWTLAETDCTCLMKKSRSRCGLTTERGRAKAPTNAELYGLLTGEPAPEGLHDALVDIKVTARSYVEGMRRNWW
jgi:DNA polymerase III epsilon subunit-like protein